MLCGDHEQLIPKNERCRMLNIKILGSGCARCESLDKLARKAVEEMHLDARVEKVSDIRDILSYEIMRTPALVINEKVVMTGRVPAMTEMKSLLFNLSMK